MIKREIETKINKGSQRHRRQRHRSATHFTSDSPPSIYANLMQ